MKTRLITIALVGAITALFAVQTIADSELKPKEFKNRVKFEGSRVDFDHDQIYINNTNTAVNATDLSALHSAVTAAGTNAAVALQIQITPITSTIVSNPAAVLITSNATVSGTATISGATTVSNLTVNGGAAFYVRHLTASNGLASGQLYTNATGALYLTTW